MIIITALTALTAKPGTDAEFWPSVLIAAITALITAVLALGGGWLALGSQARKAKTDALIAKRISVYDEIVPRANDILCFSTATGGWRDMTPALALEAKRAMGRSWHVYGPIFSKDSQNAYAAFTETFFEKYTGRGRDARLRADRAPLAKQWGPQWRAKWDEQFATGAEIRTADELRAAYAALVAALGRDLGV